MKGAVHYNFLAWMMLSLGLISLATALAPVPPGSGPFWLRAQIGTPLLWLVDAMVPVLLGYGLAARARTMTQAERITQLRDEYRKQVDVLLARAESLDARNRVYQEHLNSYGTEADGTANAETGHLSAEGREPLASGPLPDAIQQQLQTQQKMLKGIHLMLQIQHAELARLSAGLRAAPVLEGNERGMKGNKGEEKTAKEIDNAEEGRHGDLPPHQTPDTEYKTLDVTETPVASPMPKIQWASSNLILEEATVPILPDPATGVTGDTLRFEVEAINGVASDDTPHPPTAPDSNEVAKTAELSESSTVVPGSTRIAPRRRRREPEAR